MVNISSRRKSLTSQYKTKLNYMASVREQTMLSDRLLSVKLMPTFLGRECHVVSMMDPYGRIIGFLDWNCYFFFQVAPQLYLRGRVDSVPGQLLLRKFGNAGYRT
jgi:hypothetical protein